tara:strand:- start:184291 stop:184611 length:321 start_codon:yes stop_codon:yes gene_type:complete
MALQVADHYEFPSLNITCAYQAHAGYSCIGIVESLTHDIAKEGKQTVFDHQFPCKNQNTPFSQLRRLARELILVYWFKAKSSISSATLTIGVLAVFDLQHRSEILQ